MRVTYVSTLGDVFVVITSQQLKLVQSFSTLISLRIDAVPGAYRLTTGAIFFGSSEALRKWSRMMLLNATPNSEKKYQIENIDDGRPEVVSSKSLRDLSTLSEFASIPGQAIRVHLEGVPPPQSYFTAEAVKRLKELTRPQFQTWMQQLGQSVKLYQQGTVSVNEALCTDPSLFIYLAPQAAVQVPTSRAFNANNVPKQRSWRGNKRYDKNIAEDDAKLNIAQTEF